MKAYSTVTKNNPWITDTPIDDPRLPCEWPDVSLGSVPPLPVH
jgi:hypothetical protein